MKTILFVLLLMQGFYCVAQSQLDERITTLIDSLKLSDKKLEKLEQIRKLEGVNSENWARAYAKWDKSNALDEFPIREEILRLYGESNPFAFRYKSGAGLGSEYIISLMDQMAQAQNMNSHSRVFCLNVLHHQGDSSSFEILHDVSEIKRQIEYDEYLGGSGITDYRKMNQFIENYFPGWLGLELNSVYDSITSMSFERLGLLSQFCSSNGLSSPQVNGIGSIIGSFNTDSGSDFIRQLRMTFGLNNSTIKPSERWNEHIRTNYLMWKPFFENESIREIVIGNMLYQQLITYELATLDQSKFGESSMASTEKNASFWYSQVENEILGIFRVMKYHEKMGDLETYELMSAMQNGIYFQFIPGRDNNYAQLDKLSIDDLDLSTEQRVVIDDFVKYGQVAPENHHLVQKDVVNTSWQQNIQFRMALYLANLKCAQTTTSDWFGNQVKENPFDGSIALPRDNVSQTRLDYMKRNIYLRTRESKVIPSRYIITTRLGSMMTCFPPLTEPALTEVRNAVKGMYRDYERLANHGYNRLVIDMNQMKEAETNVQPVLEEVRLEPKGERVAVEVRSVTDKNIAVAPPPPYEMSAHPNLQIIPEIVDFPDVEASFPGGEQARKDWIAANIVYPEISRELGDQGRVYVSFIVEVDGSITGIEVPRSLTTELDREAKRLVREMPKWTPGLVKGEKVRSRCRIPITFTLQ